MYSKTSQLANRVKKKKPKNERKKLVKLLDDEVRRIIRERDKNCCSCGKRLDNTIQVSHYVGRRHYALRWDLRNCNGSCPGCNLLHAWNPLPYSLYIVSKFGQEILVEFLDVKNSYVKTTTPQLKDKLLELKAWKLPIANT